MWPISPACFSGSRTSALFSWAVCSDKLAKNKATQLLYLACKSPLANMLTQLNLPFLATRSLAPS